MADASAGARILERRPSRPGVPRGGRRLLVLAAPIVAVVLAIAGVVVYLETRPPSLVNLKVTDGSTVGEIKWNITTLDASPTTGVVLDFEATTIASDGGSGISTLALRLHTWTLYVGPCQCVVVNVVATAAGSFAAGLHPASFRIEANETGSNISLSAWPPEPPGSGFSWPGEQPLENVSFDTSQQFYIIGNGTGSTMATVYGETSPGPYHFSYSSYFEVHALPQYNHFLGFRFTVGGGFAPDVTVGVLLKIINTQGGVWV